MLSSSIFSDFAFAFSANFSNVDAIFVCSPAVMNDKL